jgi:hypothetical protein
LKKRTKKLLLVAGYAGGTCQAWRQRATVRSFLVLFFQKRTAFFLAAAPKKTLRMLPCGSMRNVKAVR